jgi:ACR3 family arsenite transporter
MVWFASLITRHLTLTIPIAMVLGFAYGMLLDAAPLKMLILPLTFLMVYPMMINLKIAKVFDAGGGKVQLMTQFLNFAVIPFVALGLGYFFFGDQPYLILGLFLASLLPTSGMTISYTGLSKGNMEAAIKMTVIGLIIGSIAAPAYLEFFLGATLEIDLVSVASNIVLIVFLPMAAGFATQRFLIKRFGQEAFNKEIGPKCGPFSTLGVTGVVFVATALKARAITEDPTILPYILLPLVIFYILNYSISLTLGKILLPRGDAIALLYGTVMRNLSIALAVTMNAFGEEGSAAALIISLAYIIQVQSAAWFVKFTDKVFGPPESQPGQESGPPKGTTK